MIWEMTKIEVDLMIKAAKYVVEINKLKWWFKNYEILASHIENDEDLRIFNDKRSKICSRNKEIEMLSWKLKFWISV